MAGRDNTPFGASEYFRAALKEGASGIQANLLKLLYQMRNLEKSGSFSIIKYPTLHSLIMETIDRVLGC